MTEREIFELFDLYGNDMGDYYEIEVGRIERLVKDIEFWSAPKDLTDEEILQEAENMFGTHFFECIDDPYWIEFARAILRKAQEK